MSENYEKAGDILSRMFDGFNKDKSNESMMIINSWKQIVGSIKTNKESKSNLGAALASHSKVVDLKNKVLLVETDHPGYIQTMQMYNSYIMKGLKMKCPTLEISAISYRLKGTNYQLSDKKERIEGNVYKKDENEVKEKKLKDKDLVIDDSMPEPLKKVMEKLKMSLLTKE